MVDSLVEKLANGAGIKSLYPPAIGTIFKKFRVPIIFVEYSSSDADNNANEKVFDFCSSTLMFFTLK